MGLHVPQECTLEGECAAAPVAPVGPLAGVDPAVRDEMGLLRKRDGAAVAAVRALPRVAAHVPCQVGLARERVGAVRALVRPLSGVRAFVVHQVLPGQAAHRAELAPEGPVVRVHPDVASQARLVRERQRTVLTRQRSPDCGFPDAEERVSRCLASHGWGKRRDCTLH